MSETKIERFVRSLNEDRRTLPSGPFTAQPWCDLHNIYSGWRFVGNIKGDNLTTSPYISSGAAEWLRETWRLIDAPPAIPPRVRRFMDALVASQFTCMARRGENVAAPFTVKFYPREGLMELSGNGVQLGTVREDRFSPYEQIIGEDASMSLERLWDKSDSDQTSKQPEMSSRVQRFLDALAEYEIGFKDDFGYTVEAPFTVNHLRSSGILITIGNGVEFGEIDGDHFVADKSMVPTMRATLEHIWRETIRAEAILTRIADLEAECAEKTRRLDQIKAILEGGK